MRWINDSYIIYSYSTNLQNLITSGALLFLFELRAPLLGRRPCKGVLFIYAIDKNASLVTENHTQYRLHRWIVFGISDHPVLLMHWCSALFKGVINDLVFRISRWCAIGGGVNDNCILRICWCFAIICIIIMMMTSGSCSIDSILLDIVPK
jgi:hypothetical protein